MNLREMSSEDLVSQICECLYRVGRYEVANEYDIEGEDHRLPLTEVAYRNELLRRLEVYDKCSHCFKRSEQLEECLRNAKPE
jgi:hypothetical protein